MHTSEPLENTPFFAAIQKGEWESIALALAARPRATFTAADYWAEGLYFVARGGTAMYPQATHCLTQAHRLAPTEPRILLELSELCLKVGRVAMGLHYAGLARLYAPQNFLAHLGFGRAAVRCNELYPAGEAFYQAWQLAPPALRAPLVALAYPFSPLWQQPLTGRRVSIVRLGYQHRNFLLKARANTEFQMHYHRFQAATEVAVEQDLAQAALPPTESKQIQWVVLRDGLPIGLAGLVDMDFKNGRAEYLLGFPDRPAAGVALAATLLIFEFAFSRCGLRKLVSIVYGDNPTAQANTEHLGFRPEGVLAAHIEDPLSGHPLSLNINGLTADRFFADTHTAALFAKLLKCPLSPFSPEMDFRQWATPLPVNFDEVMLEGLRH